MSAETVALDASSSLVPADAPAIIDSPTLEPTRKGYVPLPAFDINNLRFLSPLEGSVPLRHDDAILVEKARVVYDFAATKPTGNPLTIEPSPEDLKFFSKLDDAIFEQLWLRNEFTKRFNTAPSSKESARAERYSGIINPVKLKKDGTPWQRNVSVKLKLMQANENGLNVTKPLFKVVDEKRNELDPVTSLVKNTVVSVVFKLVDAYYFKETKKWHVNVQAVNIKVLGSVPGTGRATPVLNDKGEVYYSPNVVSIHQVNPDLFGIGEMNKNKDPTKAGLNGNVMYGDQRIDVVIENAEVVFKVAWHKANGKDKPPQLTLKMTPELKAIIDRIERAVFDKLWAVKNTLGASFKKLTDKDKTFEHDMAKLVVVGTEPGKETYLPVRMDLDKNMEKHYTFFDTNGNKMEDESSVGRGAVVTAVIRFPYAWASSKELGMVCTLVKAQVVSFGSSPNPSGGPEEEVPMFF